MVRTQHRYKGIPIKMALLERGMTQKDAGKYIGCGEAAFNRKLLGYRTFTAQERKKLAILLGKSEEELFAEYKPVV